MRHIQRIRGLAVVILIFAVACGGGDRTAEVDPAVENGKKTYDRICATCHGKDANGMPRLGKGLRNNTFTQSLSDSELIEFLEVGRSASDPLNITGIEMPPRGGDPSIDETELAEIVAFLRTL